MIYLNNNYLTLDFDPMAKNGTVVYNTFGMS